MQKIVSPVEKEHRIVNSMVVPRAAAESAAPVFSHDVGTRAPRLSGICSGGV